jgi:transposase InsO family protein
VARPKRRWRTTTDSRHNETIAPNRLQRDFTATKPDHVWVADTTYLPVLGGFIFPVAIIDLFSRKVVGRCATRIGKDIYVRHCHHARCEV